MEFLSCRPSWAPSGPKRPEHFADPWPRRQGRALPASLEAQPKGWLVFLFEGSSILRLKSAKMLHMVRKLSEFEVWPSTISSTRLPSVSPMECKSCRSDAATATAKPQRLFAVTVADCCCCSSCCRHCCRSLQGLCAPHCLLVLLLLHLLPPRLRLPGIQTLSSNILILSQQDWAAGGGGGLQQSLLRLLHLCKPATSSNKIALNACAFGLHA